MSLGMQVGVGPSDFVLHGDPLPQKGAQPPLQFLETGCLLWPNGCIDRDATWPRPCHIVLDVYPAPSKGHSLQFSAHVYYGQTVAHLSYTAERLLIELFKKIKSGLSDTQCKAESKHYFNCLKSLAISYYFITRCRLLTNKIAARNLKQTLIQRIPVKQSCHNRVVN